MGLMQKLNGKFSDLYYVKCHTSVISLGINTNMMIETFISFNFA